MFANLSRRRFDFSRSVAKVCRCVRVEADLREMCGFEEFEGFEGGGGMVKTESFVFFINLLFSFFLR